MLLGTINKSRREVPVGMLPNRLRTVYTCKFGLAQDMMLLSYVPRQNRAVMLLSTMHTKPEVASDGLPLAIRHYNQTKGGVDTVDKLLHTYTTLRKCKRWPATMFYHLIDMAALNALIVFRKCHPSWGTKFRCRKRKEFIYLLAEHLTSPLIRNRVTDQPHGLRRSVMSAIQQVQTSLSEEQMDASSQAQPEQKRGSCFLCPVRSRSSKKCARCNRYVCRSHFVNVCNKCI